MKRIGDRIYFDEPTKVQKAWNIFFMWLHEVKNEMAEDAHPSWKGYTVEQFKRIKEIVDTMTDEEKKELAGLHPFFKAIYGKS